MKTVRFFVTTGWCGAEAEMEEEFTDEEFEKMDFDKYCDEWAQEIVEASSWWEEAEELDEKETDEE